LRSIQKRPRLKHVGLSRSVTLFAWGENQAAYIPVRAPLGEDCLPIETVHRYIKPILENPAIRKVGQNLKYDLIVFRGQGINVQGIYFDTMVADYLLDPGQRNHSLDELAKRLF
jgi:DNA polymerase-1